MQANPVHLIPSNPSGNLWTMFCSQFNKLTHTQKYFCLQQELTDFEGIEGHLHENHVNSLQKLRVAIVIFFSRYLLSTLITNLILNIIITWLKYYSY